MIQDPDNGPDPQLGGVYTPVDPLPDMEDMTDDDIMAGDPALDQSDLDSQGNPAERPEQPALDGSDEQPSPGSDEQEADFEYGNQDADQVNG